MHLMQGSISVNIQEGQDLGWSFNLQGKEAVGVPVKTCCLGADPSYDAV